MAPPGTVTVLLSPARWIVSLLLIATAGLLCLGAFLKTFQFHFEGLTRVAPVHLFTPTWSKQRVFKSQGVEGPRLFFVFWWLLDDEVVGGN